MVLTLLLSRSAAPVSPSAALSFLQIVAKAAVLLKQWGYCRIICEYICESFMMKYKMI